MPDVAPPKYWLGPATILIRHSRLRARANPERAFRRASLSGFFVWGEAINRILRQYHIWMKTSERREWNNDTLEHEHSVGVMVYQ